MTRMEKIMGEILKEQYPVATICDTGPSQGLYCLGQMKEVIMKAFAIAGGMTGETDMFRPPDEEDDICKYRAWALGWNAKSNLILETVGDEKMRLEEEKQRAIEDGAKAVIEHPGAPPKIACVSDAHVSLGDEQDEGMCHWRRDG